MILKKRRFPTFKMGKKMERFILLMWKNWKLQIRHPVQTLFEILVPVFFCAILVLVRSLVDTKLVKEKHFSAFAPVDEGTLKNIKDFCYSPNGTEVNTIMMNFANLTVSKVNLIPFANEAALETFLGNANTMDKIAIVFPDSTTDTIPNNVDVTIRFPSELHKDNPIIVENWRTNLIYPLLLMPGPREINQTQTATPGYFQEGFLTVQTMISRTLIEHFYEKEGKHSGYLYNILMSRYPFPQFVDDPVLPVLEQMIGLIIVLAFVYTSISTIKVITAEKEKQLKESMKIMGLPSWLHWTAWFIKSLLFMLISIIIMVILFKGDFFYETGIPPVFPKCDPLLMFIFLLLYICATITFCFAVSVFFSKANLASGIGGVMFFLFFVPYSVSQNKYQYLTKSTKIFSSFLANSAMGFGFRILCMFESTEEGLQWSNLWRTATPDDNLVMGEILVMLLVDSILYLCVCLYVEAIFPGRYGVPKKWNFIFTSLAAKWKIQGAPSARGTVMHDPATYEEEPTDSKPGIEIKHLNKVYAGNKVAVHDFSMNMFENQITVLLGHNGAGKTTTMSMLTGMFPPTSGTAIVNGYDIRTDMNHVRSSLGLCPQHNILFDELTVSEHIYFYSKLKGMRPSEIGKEIDDYLKLLQLEDKRNKMSSTLSGGMKRKLSVAVAFCGNSKVVMLDEPTAGMDPAARRALWEMVESQKEGRTIMLTTHFMDEADLLGDRIAIMAGGTLQCCGSSYFLKKKYGAGYHLIMDKSYTCDVEAVTKVLRSHIPSIRVESNIGSELSYLLNEEDSAVFQDMLKDIEINSAALGIRSYGISLTTLEEVFMKVGAEDHIIERRVTLENNPAVEQMRATSDRRITVENALLTGYQLRKNQFIAMFMKRALSTLRSWPLLALQLIIPVLLLIFAIQAAKQSSVQELPKLKISLESYRNPITVLRTDDVDYPLYKIALNYTTKMGWDVKDLRTDNLEDDILKITEENLSTVRMHYVIGAEVVNNSIVGWFNNDPFHSPPLALSFIMNIFLKDLGPQYEINIYNHPLPYLISSKFKMMNQGNNMGFQLAFNIGFCMSFISAFYVLFYIKERICKCKHLQFVSGVNIIIFWLASYIWDWITFALTIVVLLITLVCFQEEGFKSIQDIGHLILVFSVFGFSMLPLIYIVSFVFNMPSSGFIRVILFTMICGTFAFMVVEILSVEAFKLTHIAKVLDWICTFVPHYSMSTAIKNINLEYLRFTNCKKMVDFCMNYLASEDLCWTASCKMQSQCCERKEDYYKWEKPGILRNILFSFLVGIILLAILFLKEYKIFTLINYLLRRKKRNFIDAPDDDSDVIDETNMIRGLTENEIKNYNLVLKNVTKYYGNFLAVNGVCLGVRGYECFGLLGVNGAGKTSTFQMMTGDTQLSNGDIYVNGLDLKTKMKEINELTGYCPQFDALLDDLSARETIKMFGILRGFTVHDCLVLAEKLANMFDFHKHLDKKVRDLSGGNKRKLSTAIALIGDPPILYLDEPTTGMDPATKRYLWDALCHVRDSGKCLILTSHSMEECEALCTRLAIMVNGRFKCLGSTQHLKNKFSRGYTLTIKLRKRPTSSAAHAYHSNVEGYIKEVFPTAIVREKHQELITFYMETMLPWSTLFGIMEEAKSSLDIEDYSLGQSSLEQVFLSFTKSQSAQE